MNGGVNKMLKRVIPFAHHLIEQAVQPGDCVVDATCGNGHDTVMLSRATSDLGKVYAFDIQAEAIENTKKRLADESITNVELIHDSHDRIGYYIDQTENQQIGAAIFNLGYLPGSDKSVITKPNHTIDAIQQIIDRLKLGGLIVCVVYHGHPGGKEEKDALLEYVKQLDQKIFNCISYGFINQKNNPPFVIAIEKKSDRLN